ncbi:AfsA-related hotdog domain-containing protein [Streptomyces sp. NBC_01236]|uniref:AfsA-related hotdog domain-containing protein n=1 Tax=Streptomyces sp. NBC_01236 TaxID=2903789 RepID=UPI003FA39714
MLWKDFGWSLDPPTAYADPTADTARAVPLPPPAGLTPFGRDRFEDAVLAATDRPDRWQLRVDTTHPALFDHLVDHAPGILLLEAARQAARAHGTPRHDDAQSPAWTPTSSATEHLPSAPPFRVEV